MDEVKDDLSLPALVREYSKIAEILATTGGELTPELEEQFKNLDIQTAGKIDGYHFLMKRLESEAEFWEEEAKRRKQIADGCYSIIDRLKGGILYAMTSLGTNEITGNAVRAKLSPTKGRLSIDDSILSDEWKITEIKKVPDKERIREALEAFETIPGAKIEGGFSVRFYNVKTDKKKVNGDV